MASFMSPDSFRDALILTGPTGSGKTEGPGNGLVTGGRRNRVDGFDGPYRGMDIGTAKPSRKSGGGFPTICRCLEPWESASVAWWLDKPVALRGYSRQRGKRILIVGGTPLYLKALSSACSTARRRTRPFDGVWAEEANRPVRPRCSNGFARSIPPRRSALHPNDVRRVIRALEVWELTGKPSSATGKRSGRRQRTRAPRTGRRCCLDPPRSELYARIDRRVVRMIEEGWVDEVQRLRLSQGR